MTRGISDDVVMGFALLAELVAQMVTWLKTVPFRRALRNLNIDYSLPGFLLRDGRFSISYFRWVTYAVSKEPYSSREYDWVLHRPV